METKFDAFAWSISRYPMRAARIRRRLHQLGALLTGPTPKGPIAENAQGRVLARLRAHVPEDWHTPGHEPVIRCSCGAVFS